MIRRAQFNFYLFIELSVAVYPEATKGRTLHRQHKADHSLYAPLKNIRVELKRSKYKEQGFAELIPVPAKVIVPKQIH